tara:strand:- start:202 stop:762 length:561 start_codon:yes stop_codon:yes gene_type:complete
MDKQILIIFKFKSLYEIIKELDNDLNLKIIQVSNETILEQKRREFKNSLIITQKKLIYINHLILDDFPIKITKFLEKVNVEFLKLKFIEKSKKKIGRYIMDLNSRYLIQNNKKLKLTEKEATIISYLFESNLPVKIEELQKNVWGFNSKLDTHTVETHVYRLRKKILNNFQDSKFIVSEKNGYKIK